MQFRTDLAMERNEVLEQPNDGIVSEEFDISNANVSRIRVINEKGARAIGKPIGTYITITVPPLSNAAGLDEELHNTVSDEFSRLIPKEGPILVVGIGNTKITPDALGPKTANSILATRHISGEIAKSVGLDDLRPVAVLSPGVLGQTGIESGDIIAGVVERIKPVAVIAVDALTSRRLSRLGCTIQISDTGISPGAGVGNKRKEISEETLGVPVISVGVPTVVDATTLAYDLIGEEAENKKEMVEPRGAGMIVTPREIDLLVDRAAELVSHTMNCALQPTISPQDLLMLVN